MDDSQEFYEVSLGRSSISSRSSGSFEKVEFAELDNLHSSNEKSRSPKDMNEIKPHSKPLVTEIKEETRQTRPKPPTIESFASSLDDNLSGEDDDFKNLAALLDTDVPDSSRASPIPGTKPVLLPNISSPPQLGQSSFLGSLPRPAEKHSSAEITANNSNNLFKLTSNSETQSFIAGMLMKEEPNSPQMLPIKVQSAVKKEIKAEISPKPVKIEEIAPMKPITLKEKAETVTKKKSKYQLHQEKKQKRLIRNRLSAKMHRDKRRQETELLDGQVKSLKAENALLRGSLAKLKILESDNEMLKREIRQHLEEIQLLRDENLRMKCELEAVKADKLFDDIDFSEEELKVMATPARSTCSLDSSDSHSKDYCSTDSDESNKMYRIFEGEVNKGVKRTRTESSKPSVRSRTRRARTVVRKKVGELKSMAKNRSKSSTVIFFGLTFFLSFFNLNIFSVDDLDDSPPMEQSVARWENDLTFNTQAVETNSRSRSLFETEILEEFLNASEADFLVYENATSAMSSAAAADGEIVVFGDESKTPVKVDLSSDTKVLVPLSPQQAIEANKRSDEQPSWVFTPGVKRQLFLPTSRGKMMNFALANREETLPSNKLELVRSTSTSMSLERNEDLIFKTELWTELNKLTELLQSKRFIEIDAGRSFREVDSSSQAVTLYQGDWNPSFVSDDGLSREFIRLEAVHSALASYIHYLTVGTAPTPTEKDFFNLKQDFNAKDSLILCPGAYGMLFDLPEHLVQDDHDSLEDQVDITDDEFGVVNESSVVNPKRRLRSAEVEVEPKEIEVELEEEIFLRIDESHVDNATMSIEDLPKLTLLVPANVRVQGDGSATEGGAEDDNSQRLVELTCRVEAINDFLSGPRNS